MRHWRSRIVLSSHVYKSPLASHVSRLSSTSAPPRAKLQISKISLARGRGMWYHTRRMTRQGGQIPHSGEMERFALFRGCGVLRTRREVLSLPRRHAISRRGVTSKIAAFPGGGGLNSHFLAFCVPRFFAYLYSAVASYYLSQPLPQNLQSCFQLGSSSEPNRGFLCKNP